MAKVVGFVDSSFALIKGESAKAKVFKYDFLCAIYNNGTHDYIKALGYADSMLQNISKSKDKKFVNEYLLIANYSMGDANFNLKKYNEAFKYYYKAKELAASAVDSFAMQDYNYRLGMVMYRQGNYLSANSYFKTSLRQINYGKLKFATFIRKQELINNVALTFYKLGLHDSALNYYNQGLTYLEENKELAEKRNLVAVAKGVIYGNMAQVFIDYNQFDQAEELLKKSIAINSQKGYDNRDAQFAQINLGKLYLDKNKTEKAFAVIDNLKSNLGTVANDEALLRLNELSYKYYNKVGQPLQALHSLQAFLQIKDSLFSKNKDLVNTDVNELMNSIESQYKIELLQKKNEFQKISIAVAAVMLLMVSLIIFLVYKNYKRSKRNIVVLTELNNDIQDKKIALDKAMTRLEKESKSKDQILKVVAHDLRNPLHGIAGLSGIIIDEEGLSKHQTHVMSLIQNSCKDALQLINELLEVAGLTEVKKLTRQPTDINAMVSHAVDLLKTKALEKNQLIVLDVSKEPEPVFINREKMTRVISNLITNSIKFSPAHEEIHVRTQHSKEGVLISVKDKGIGIPPNLAETIFDTFTSAKRPGTSGEKSFGLGLSICRQIVEAHVGKIWFESEPGMGTTFHVQLN
ncbi:MAG TPA: tetratricopeptide repeat-containing sensor histidine kinase [Segetibacter sp.]